MFRSLECKLLNTVVLTKALGKELGLEVASSLQPDMLRTRVNDLQRAIYI